MSDSNFKTIRKQLRNIVQELLPNLLKQEIVDAIKKEVADQMSNRMEAIAVNVRESLDKIGEDQKKFQEFATRQLSLAAPLPNVLATEAVAVEGEAAQVSETIQQD